ncbi:M24 family metallopeptidase [Symbiobacterium thermophilum]|uniref:Xaa-Pro dipeptidase n=1 Tax=Symbiobacterium thermophilum TaxID=2734 RepID=A0A953I7F4_SYMTR|nr:Xaa-Pro peptidase family protein [Symbiobacterium thermophilum]MBY6275688.1 Xaa-Pro dipeptidase [Symbiobacterium thermophilum]
MTQARLARLRARLEERGLDAVLIAKPHNRAYLSGFTGSAGLLLITADRAALVTDFRYVEQAAAQAPEFEVIKAESANQAVLTRLVEEWGVKRIGFEGDFLTVDEHQTYQQFLAGCQWTSVSGLVEELRMIKDETEIALMRRAAEIADEAFAQILPLIKPGVIERDLATELEYRMKKLGAEGVAFETIVASGARSSLPHGVASDKAIEVGDLITFDFGAVYQGYCSDMTRTVMLGEPTDKQREIYGIVLEAQKRGVAACRPGITGRELDDVCRSYIAEKGYREYFGHGTGHGVGRYIHEGPRVSQRGGDVVLRPGMVVTVEPGIYLPGWGGVRIEDMLLVTESGAESFTHSPKELLIL